MSELSQNNPQPESIRSKLTRSVRSFGDSVRRRYSGRGEAQSPEEPLPLTDGPEVSFEQHRENERRRFLEYIGCEKARDVADMKEFKYKHLKAEIVEVDPEQKFYGTKFFQDKKTPERLTAVTRDYHRNYIKGGVNHIGGDFISFKSAQGGFEFSELHIDPEIGMGGGLSAGFSREEGEDTIKGFHVNYGIRNRRISLGYNADGSISRISFSVARLQNPDQSRTRFHIDDELPSTRITEVLKQGSVHISGEEIPPEARYEHIDKEPYKNDYNLETTPDGDMILTRINNGVVKDRVVFAQQIDLAGLSSELFDSTYIGDPIKAPYEADKWRNNIPRTLQVLGLGQWEQHDLEIVPKLSTDVSAGARNADIVYSAGD